MPLIFYDTETTGTTPAFDQVLQLGAVLTDDELNIHDQFEVSCRLLSYVVPSPEALLTTSFTEADLFDNPVSHYVLARSVFLKFEEWCQNGAIFIGWNSMRFDELMLRHLYYKTLQPVYQTQLGGNGRADLMKIAQIISAIRPGAIRLRKVDGARASFRLEDVSRENLVSHHRVHDAIYDTAATLDIARIIRAEYPDFWLATMANAHKSHVIDMLKEQNPLLLVETGGGSSRVCVCAPVAENSLDRNEWAAFDLSYDPLEFFEAPDDALISSSIENPCPIRLIRTNTQPGLYKLDKWVAMAYQSTDESRQRQRAALVVNNGKFRNRISRILARRRKPFPKSEYVEEQIYENFPTASVQRLLSLFHNARWEERIGIVNQIEDTRYRQLGQRLIATERPDLLTPDQARRYNSWLGYRVLTDEEVPWLTVPKAMRRIEELETSGETKNQNRLRQVRQLFQRLKERLR